MNERQERDARRPRRFAFRVRVNSLACIIDLPAFMYCERKSRMEYSVKKPPCDTRLNEESRRNVFRQM